MVAAEIAAISSSSMSSREKNRAIRKAKMLAKQRSKDASKEGDSFQSNRYKLLNPSLFVQNCPQI